MFEEIIQTSIVMFLCLFFACLSVHNDYKANIFYLFSLRELMRESFGYCRAGGLYSEESTCKVLKVFFEPFDVGVVAFKGGKFTDQSSNS